MRRPEPEALSAYLEGELSAAEREAFLAGLDAEARAEVDALEAALVDLETLPEVEPPAGLAESVLARLPERRGARARRWLAARPLLGWRVAGVSAVAAVVLALGLAFDGGAPREVARPAAGPGLTSVRFVLRAPEAHAVALAGTFNGWRPGALLLERGAGGLWAIDVLLPAGRHEYMFVVDGRIWVADPAAPAFRDDGFGRRNAVIDL